MKITTVSAMYKIKIDTTHIDVLMQDVLVQERRNSIANALDLRLSCTIPSICSISATIKI